jgi:hypothetical protein
VVVDASPGGGGTGVGREGYPGHGRVPVPRHNRASCPEAGISLLALRARQPAESVDAPAGTDRTGADVGLAERCGIGVPGYARAHLAPHDWHPQLITDYRPLVTRGVGSSLGPCSGLGTGQSLGPGGSFGEGGSLGTGSGLGPGGSLGTGGSLSPGSGLRPSMSLGTGNLSLLSPINIVSRGSLGSDF